MILRDQSARRTLGGGRVIDPFPPKRGRAKPERLERLDALVAEDPATALTGLLALSPEGVDLGTFAKACNLSTEAEEGLWRDVAMVRTGTGDGMLGLTGKRHDALRQMLLQSLSDRHSQDPGAKGVASAELRRDLPERLSVALFDAMIHGLVEAGDIAVQSGLLSKAGYRPQMAPEDADLWDKISPQLEAGGPRPPKIAEIAENIGMNAGEVERFLAQAAKLGLVLRVSGNRFFLPDAVLELGKAAEKVASDAPEGRFTVAAFRDETGIGRNLAIEVLEIFRPGGFHRTPWQ